MNGCHREDDKTLTRLIWTRVLVGALIRFAVIVAWKLINVSPGPVFPQQRETGSSACAWSLRLTDCSRRVELLRKASCIAFHTLYLPGCTSRKTSSPLTSSR